MRIETDRCVIREMRPGDAEALYAVYSDPEVMKHIEPPFSMEQTRAFIAEAGLGAHPLVFALELKAEGVVIGHVIDHAYEGDERELGWIIGAAYWGRGLATEVTAALIAHARRAGVGGVVLECAPEQRATVAIAERFGFAYRQSSGGRNVYALRL